MYILIAIISYLLGSIPFSYIVAKAWGKNLYEVGSGNIGTANVYRATGKAESTLLALLGDLGKGVLAIYLAQRFSYLGYNPIIGQAVAAFFAVAGHNWPIFLKFKGGKGLATLAGIILFLNFKAIIFTIAIIVFFIFFAEIIMRRGIKLEGNFKEKVKKLLSVLISQITGRVIGILAAAIMILIFYPVVFKIAAGAAILSAIKHIGRLKDFVKTKHAI